MLFNPTATRETYWRSLQTFNVTRVVIAAVLLVYLSFSHGKLPWMAAQPLYWQLCLGYLLISILLVILTHHYRKNFLSQLMSQILFDIVIISILFASSGGGKTGLGILYLFPLVGGAILAPQALALFFASIVSIFMLAESGYRLLTEGADLTMQAGLYGATFFASVFVMNRLAARLIHQEELALEHGKNLQTQMAINKLVIADMGDGLLVVGDDTEVVTYNPAAHAMLGPAIPEKQPWKLADSASLAPIADAFLAWKANPFSHTNIDAASGVFLLIKPEAEEPAAEPAPAWGNRGELARHLRLRFVPVDTAGLKEARTIIFLQDISQIENQAQQLKLASMGRLTASIAHEVRNPLAAIGHAAALLEEEDNSPLQTRLLGMVGENVARVNRMIEDILNLSRKAQLHGEPILLADFIAGIKEECEEKGILPKEMLWVGKMKDYKVRFDPLHLREIILNLLTNAVRYASKTDHSIRIYAVAHSPRRIELHVQDDGASITPEVRSHLFEPFYTTSSKGTGLGLYLARELCLNNGAMLDYEYRAESWHRRTAELSGRFVITFGYHEQPQP